MKVRGQGNIKHRVILQRYSDLKINISLTRLLEMVSSPVRLQGRVHEVK